MATKTVDNNINIEELKAQLMKQLKEEMELEKQKDSDNKLKDDTLITVRSVCTGTLTVITKDGEVYDFLERGEVQEIPYRQLLLLKRSKPLYFTSPMFIVEDGRAVEALRLGDLYKNIFPILQDVIGYFKTCTEEEAIKTLNEIPQFLRMEIIIQMAEAWANNTYRDFKVKSIIRHFNIDVEEEASKVSQSKVNSL